MVALCNLMFYLCVCRFGLLKMCWEEDPEIRPSFAQLVDVFTTLLESTQVQNIVIFPYINPPSQGWAGTSGLRLNL